jgi:hypothetical protein
MATTSNYFVVNTNGDNTNFIDFDLRYGALTTAGESVQYNGSPFKDAVFVRPGLTYDLTNTADANDKIYLFGSLADYTLQADSVNHTLTLTRPSLNESVKVSSGTAQAFDSLIFTNGVANTLELFNAVVNSGTLPTPNASVETSLTPLASSGAGASAILNATINAYAINQNGETFASVRHGINFIVNGSGGVDKVYVADGESVNAINLSGGVDLIYMRGNWANYTKALNTVNNTITFTRIINGLGESITVAIGTLQAPDRVIFADGTVNTYNASIALTSSLTSPIAGITGYNPAITTPLYNDTQVAVALAVIRDAAQGNSANDTTPSLLTYVAAGVTGVTAGNLAAINSALNSVPVTGSQADTAVNVQAIVNAYIAILTEANDTADTTGNSIADANIAINPTVAQYALIGADIGLAASVATNLSLLNDIVGAKQTVDVDMVNEINALAVIANAIQSVAAGGTPSPALTATDLTNAGLANVTADNLAAVIAAIAAKDNGGGETDSLGELQTLVTGLNTAATALGVFAGANSTGLANATGTVPTEASYIAAGVTGVTAGNLAAINDALASLSVGAAQADSPAEVQSIVNAYIAILAEANDTTDTAGNSIADVNTAINPTVAQYVLIGAIIGTAATDSENLSLLNDIVGAKQFADVDTVGEINELAVIANAIQSVAAGGTDVLTVADLTKAGLANVTADNLAAVIAAIAAKDNGGGETDALGELQTLVTGLNTAATTLGVFAQANTLGVATPTGTVPVLADYTAAGVTGVTDGVNGNLAVINDALASLPVGATQADTPAEVQAIVNAYIAILAEANDTTNTAGDDTADATPLVDPTVAQYALIGATIGTAATDSENLSLLNDIVGAKQFADVDTVGEINALAVIANAIQSVAAGGTPSPALTATDLTNAGLANVTADNLAAVIAAIAAKDNGGSETDSLGELQTLVTGLNTAATALGVFAQANTSGVATPTGTVPVLADYTAAGVIGVSTNNLTAINDALASLPVGATQADTPAELQSIVNAYIAILAEANDTTDTAGNSIADANTAINPTVAQYALIGAAIGTATTDVENLSLLNDIVGAKQTVDVDSIAEINELARIANAIQTVAADGTPSPVLTTADFTKAGLTDVTDSNLSAVIAAIAVKDNGGGETDTLGELQTIITTIASHYPVLTTVLGGVTNLDVTSNLVLTSTRSLNVGTGLIRFTDLGGSNGGTGFHNDIKTNSFNINVATAVADGLLSFDTTHTKIIINPKYDLDLSSNYSVSIDAGAFVDQSTGVASYALAAVNFSTVTPGTHSTGGTLAVEALASRIMDANGALQPSKSWIDLESYNTNNINGITQIGDLSTGAYALVMKNYATAPGGVYPDPDDGGSVGIQLHDVSIGVSNFAANDQLYFDGQANNPTIQTFAPEFISAIQNAGNLSGGIAGQNLLNFGFDPNVTHLGSSNQIALGFQGSTTLFQYIYAQPGFSSMETNLGIPAPVVMG